MGRAAKSADPLTISEFFSKLTTRGEVWGSRYLVWAPGLPRISLYPCAEAQPPPTDKKCDWRLQALQTSHIAILSQ